MTKKYTVPYLDYSCLGAIMASFKTNKNVFRQAFVDDIATTMPYIDPSIEKHPVHPDQVKILAMGALASAIEREIPLLQMHIPKVAWDDILAHTNLAERVVRYIEPANPDCILVEIHTMKPIVGIH